MEQTVVRRQDGRSRLAKSRCIVVVHFHPTEQVKRPRHQSPHAPQRRAPRPGTLLAYVILNNGLAEKLRAIRVSDRSAHRWQGVQGARSSERDERHCLGLTNYVSVMQERREGLAEP